MGDCDMWDLPCQAESLVNTLLTGVATGIESLGWMLLTSAFGNTGGTINEASWSVAGAMASRWGLVMLIVVVGVTLFQMGTALVRGRTQQAVSAFLLGICAWPLTVFSIWLAVTLTDATDRLSIGIMTGGEGGRDSVLQHIFATMDSSEILGDDGVDSLIAKTVVLIIMAFGSLIGAFMLSFMLAFRNFALLVLIGFAPVAFLALPAGVSRQWAVRWGSAVIALIIAKPLAAGMLAMAAELLGSAEGFWRWIVGLTAMAMATFAPVITMRMLSFVGGDTAAAYGSHGTSVVTNTGAGAARAGSTVVGGGR